MRLTEEAAGLEDKLLKHAKPIMHSSALREVLQEAISEFEQDLRDLPAREREEVLALYLDKMRRVTFGFHLAMLKRATRERCANIPIATLREGVLRDHEKKMQAIGRLYRFL